MTIVNMPFSIRGAKEMQRKLSRIAKDFPDKISSALKAEAMEIARDSRDNYVPVDKGALRDSIHATEPIHSGKDISVSIVAGEGESAPYALAIHEHPSDHSPPSWQGGNVEFHPSGHGPKYLEKPLRAAAKGIPERLAKRLELGKIGKVEKV